MRPIDFCAQARLLIVAGKGGVGKTTATAALARMAADAGLRVLIVEVEGKSGIGTMFGRPGPLGYQEEPLSDDGRIVGRTLTPDDAMVEYLVDHGMKRISKRLVASGAIEVVAAGAPGIKDILVLGKVKALERSRAHDLIILDAPAAGHAVTFLTSASGLLDAVRVGPIRSQAQDVLALLSDPSRCQVLLVALPEETPVNELVETAFMLEDRVGVSLTPVIVNGVYEQLPVGALTGGASAAAEAAGVRLGAPHAEALDRAAAFRADRQALQAEQIARLAEALPLPRLELPFVFDAEIGPAQTALLAAALARQVEAL